MALRNPLPTRAMFEQAVQHCQTLGTGPMHGPLRGHRLHAVLGKVLAPDLYLRKASIQVRLSDDNLFLIVHGLHIVPADKTPP